MSETNPNLDYENPPSLNGRESARFCAGLLDRKRAFDIKIFHVEEVLQITDYFVVASGKSPRQLKGITSFLKEELKKRGKHDIRIEGYQKGRWILVDLGDVVVHLMIEEVRSFYDLELLWGDCQQVSWQKSGE